MCVHMYVYLMNKYLRREHQIIILYLINICKYYMPISKKEVPSKSTGQ